MLACYNFTERRNSLSEKNPLQTPAIEFIFSKSVGFTLRKMQKFQLIIWREDFPQVSGFHQKYFRPEICGTCRFMGNFLTRKLELGSVYCDRRET